MAAKNLNTIQQTFLRATPVHASGFASLLSPISFVRIHIVCNLTVYHRRATRNKMSDTHLGQTRTKLRHDRRVFLNTKNPMTPPSQPPTASHEVSNAALLGHADAGPSAAEADGNDGELAPPPAPPADGRGTE